MEIVVPDLNYKKAMNFCYEISHKDLGTNEDCIVDFAQVGNCDPFPMLIVSDTIRHFKKEHPNNAFIAKNCTNQYAKYMNFYRACGIGLGDCVEIAKRKSGYNSITHLSVEALRKEGIENNSIIQEVIEERAKEMAKIVAQGNTKFENWLSFVIREIVRNIPEHSESNDIWYCAQYWPYYDLVELAILDEGIGIKKSLIDGGKVPESISDEEALSLALEPGLSGASTFILDEDWKNSGFGLYMVSHMCAELDANFIITSGTAGMSIQKEYGQMTKSFFKSGVKGTAIQIRVKPSNSIDYEEIRKKIVAEGEKRAKDNQRNHSASKASKQFIL